MRRTLVYLLAAGVCFVSAQARAQQYGISGEENAAESQGAASQAGSPSGETIMAQPVGGGASAPATTTAGPRLSEEVGWNADWALLFVINNVLVQGSILNEYRNLGLAGIYYLAPDLAVRAGVEFFRDHNPPTITKNTNEVAGQNLETYTFSAGGYTSQVTGNASADLLMRLSRSSIAPYVGAGAQVSTGHTRATYDDDVSIIDQITHVRNRVTTLTTSVRGIGGAEWRLHPNFAIFAEYEALLTLASFNSTVNERRVETVVGETRSVNRERSESKRTDFLDFNNFLTQGASFGLIVMF